jgi:MFS family permease
MTMTDSPRRNVILLALCQALLLMNAVTNISVSALAGYALAANKVFSTVPSMCYVIGAAIATYPASMWMKRVGRRNGFLTGGTLGLAGSVLATIAMADASLLLLCLGTMLLGMYNAFGQYYRFAAADAAPGDFKAKAISYVLAGGVIGGVVGPELSKYTRSLMQPEFFASYASLFIYSLAAMAIISLLRLPDAASGASEQPARPLAEIVSQPTFIVAAVVAALGYAVMSLLMTATPLAMGFCGHPYTAAASVISAHVVGMFGTSFFTGSLIKRFGVLQVMMAGVAIMSGCVAVALSGQDIPSFWFALVLLGIGWNFMYVGGSTLLTETYRPSEKAKAQGVNEIIIFTVQAVAALSSGVLVNARGWNTLNYVALPAILLAGCFAGWLLWKRGLRRPKMASG